MSMMLYLISIGIIFIYYNLTLKLKKNVNIKFCFNLKTLLLNFFNQNRNVNNLNNYVGYLLPP